MPRRRASPRSPSGSRPTSAPARTDAVGRAPLAAGPIRRALLRWHRPDDRALPFRGAVDPWAVLVSEVMAQQTQAARAGDAWVAFMTRFPDAAALAAASPAEVLRAWRGLGYNRRALALQQAASVVVDQHGGRVPGTVAGLERLPGVGPYTARAVAAIAYGLPVGAVDTNVRRVISRLVGPGPAPSPRRLQELADELVDPARPGAWTHALMDVGARICRPTVADCPSCPLRPWCGTAAAAGGRAGRPSDGPDRSVEGRRPAAREGAVPFRRSNRWLRGTIVDRLRDLPDGEWARLSGPIGEHPAAAVESALEGLARDGLVERRPGEPLVARLPPGAR
jgi:A/G-specific adenine glycosylase